MLPDFPRKLYRKFKKKNQSAFRRNCPGIKVEDAENLEILGSPMGASARRDLLNKKMIELQKLSEVVTKLPAQAQQRRMQRN